jgi:hypothetical protein
MQREIEREIEKEIEGEVEREFEIDTDVETTDVETTDVETNVETHVEMEDETGNETEVEEGNKTEVETEVEREIEREIEMDIKGDIKGEIKGKIKGEIETNIETNFEKEIATRSLLSVEPVVVRPTDVLELRPTQQQPERMPTQLTVRFVCDGCSKRLKAKVSENAPKLITRCVGCGKVLEKALSENVLSDLQASLSCPIFPRCHTSHSSYISPGDLFSISERGRSCGCSESPRGVARGGCSHLSCGMPGAAKQNKPSGGAEGVGGATDAAARATGAAARATDAAAQDGVGLRATAVSPGSIRRVLSTRATSATAAACTGSF